MPSTGGHVGFHGDAGNRPWCDVAIEKFLAARLQLARSSLSPGPKPGLRAMIARKSARPTHDGCESGWIWAPRAQGFRAKRPQ